MNHRNDDRLNQKDALHSLKYAIIRIVPVFIAAVLIGLAPYGKSIAAGNHSALYAVEDCLEGSGTKNDPWLIASVYDLEIVRRAVSQGEPFEGKYFDLTSDLQLPADWLGLGSLTAGASSSKNGINIAPFSAVFNGNGYTVTTADGGCPLFSYVRKTVIRNLKIAGKNINGSGLILNYTVDHGKTGRETPKTADIENVIICKGTSVKGSGFLGGYSAAFNTVNISRCIVEEGVVIGYGKNLDKIGSFAGDFNGTITDCRSSATVYGKSYVGGLMGCKGNSMSDTSISNSVFSGAVIASGNYAGGIAGGGYGGTGWGINSAPNAPVIRISDCLCSGTVEAADVAGGIEGYETTLQAWENGQGYLLGNLFTGTVTTTNGNCKGGIVGAFRGLDRYNHINDNYYRENCGADRGIGRAEYVDTSCTTHETRYGIHYFDTSKNIPVFEGVNDVYSANLKKDHNRTDDPLGADASKLARSVTSGQLQDGTVTAYLNAAAGGRKNWKQTADGPGQAGDRRIIGIHPGAGCKVKYLIGERLDPADLKFILIWNDGSREDVSGGDSRLTVTGFDSSKQGWCSLSISAGSARLVLPVEIREPDDAARLNVHFTLYGDKLHSLLAEKDAHTFSSGNLTSWIETIEYEVDPNTTAYDLIKQALSDKGLAFEDSGHRLHGNYCVSGVQIPGSQTILRQLDNGPASCWSYRINGEDTGTNAKRYHLQKGDSLTLYFTDDYISEHKEPEPPEPVKPVKPVKPAVPKVIKGKKYKAAGHQYLVTRVASAKLKGTVSLISAANKKNVNIPAHVKLADHKSYRVTIVRKAAFRAKKIRRITIGANVKKLYPKAFAKSKATVLILKTKRLKKGTVKGSLLKSKIKKIAVRTGNKALNRKYVKKYVKIFTINNAGRKVKIR